MWKFVSAGGSSDPLFYSLNNNVGRQTWQFDPASGTPEQIQKVEQLRAHFTANRLTQKHSADELLRLQNADKTAKNAFQVPTQPLEDEEPDNERVAAHLKAAVGFYEGIQADDGHWPGDYGGPMFLMPGMLITLYTTGVLDEVLSPQHKQEMLRYLMNHQNSDGGFGLHIEGHSTMFGTGLSYVSLRILGVSASDAMCQRARAWMLERGGATYISSWGKFWLAVLNVYSWEGMNPTPPEMWLLPYSAWTGIGWGHPGRFWCHCRMVYLPMSYIYGRRGTCQDTKLTQQLRTELFAQDYDKIDWNKARNLCAKEDLYYPHPLIQDVLWWTLYQAEPLLTGSWLRKKALEECMRHIHYEDENTRYVDIGPVNKVMNMLACWFEDPDSEAFRRHIPRLYDYLWVAEDGMKMQGYNGSQLWDTAFAVQAIASANILDVSSTCLRKAHEYIDASQVRDDAPGPLLKWYRHISKGAWPFSTRDHGWPISDCSSEGLKASLVLRSLPASIVGQPIPQERLEDCINVILSYQNTNGGWATYENQRSFEILEVLNPSETFGGIIVDYSYVECSGACIQAMCAFRKQFPDHRAEEIKRSLQRGEKFIRRIQRPDGSWYGSWAVCFCYGTWFGVSALVQLGYTYKTDDAVRRACAFLLEKQRFDGGWGESYLSCQDKVYSQLDGDSHVVNTGWAMLTLMLAGYHKVDPKPLHAAARHLMKMQQPSGDWPQQTISGVFNNNCMITYANYRNIFPIWALGMYRAELLQ